jgi:peptide/nickel transport system substrate-binding protein
MLRTRNTFRLAATGALAAMALAACGGSSSGGGATKTSSEGTPVKGGTLTMLGVGDLDHADSAAWYYTTDYELGNLIARQLMTYPRDPKKKVFGETPVGDAAEAPDVSADGKTYTFHIKPGVKWNSTPPRQVTADDFIRGIERTCNPVAPFGASVYFTGTIIGFDKFCTNELKIAPSAKALSDYLAAHGKDVTGLASSDNGMTLTFNLLKPANDFPNIVALSVASAVPVEYLQYAPDSPMLATHLMSDGPYQITSYVQGKTIDLVRNPAWSSATDPNRPSYVDKIHIVENLTQEAVQQQIQAGTADMEWDTFPLSNLVPQLKAAGDPGLTISPTSSSNPYLVFNTVSPNNNAALSKTQVRQAISYGVNKQNLLQVMGGTLLNHQLNQVLPPTIGGGEKQYEPYPFDAAKAKDLLAKAGYPNGLTLKILYRTKSNSSTKIVQTLQNDLPKIGIKVQVTGASNADFYSKYMQTPPSVTKKGLWDMAIAGWGADWTGNAARTFMFPLFDGRTFAPSSSNFGDFNDPKVNALMDQAVTAPDAKTATDLWQQTDRAIMADAPFIPLSNPQEPNYHNAKRIGGFIYWDSFQNGDPTWVWIKK